MKYQMLLWPHANARYRAETVRLAKAEMQLMLGVLCPEATVTAGDSVNLPALQIETLQPLSEQVIGAIREHSLMYAFYQCTDDGLLKPAAERAEAFLGEDLPSILKYKGKTNEFFLKLLINSALYASAFAASNERIEMIDPMCGRGTSVFTAANLGWNAAGSDVDKNDLTEAEKFLKRYLEYHKYKYDLRKESRTQKAGKAVPVTNFIYAQTPEAMKQKDTRILCFAETDAGKIDTVFGRNRFHLIVSDLPYGVQHAPEKSSFTELLKRVLPVWREALKPGGTVALSFNTNTLKRSQLRDMMSGSGFTVLTGGAYDGFEHWVEQAVTRDIVIARKENLNR